MRKAPCIQPVRKKIGSSRKVGGANKGLGEATKSCTRKEHESATNSIAKRGQGGTSSLFVCPLQGQGTASLVGFGATPQLFRVKPTQRKKSTRRRQRSVPASNFALPQERPQAALPPTFREGPFLSVSVRPQKPFHHAPIERVAAAVQQEKQQQRI